MTRQQTHLLYLYGIVESETQAERMLATRQVPGLVPHEPLFSIKEGRLVAAVSRVPAETFAEAPLNELATDLVRLAPFVVRHEEAVRALAPAAPAILPMAFGAIYRSRRGLVSLLARRAPEFEQRLVQLAARDEWDLKITTEPARLQEAVESVSAAVRANKEKMASAGPGQAYLLEKQRSRLLAVEAEAFIAQAVVAMVSSLATVSDAGRRDPLESAGSSASDGVQRVTFLVPRAAEQEFCLRVSEFKQRYARQGLILELSGPWAPYSFVRM